MKYKSFLSSHWLVIFTIMFLSAGLANGATFIVTKTADTNDGVCDADCSFREALIEVNNNTTGGVTHRIEFSSLFDTPQTIETDQFFLDYNTRVEIIGRGNKNLTITTAPGSLNGAFNINSTFCRIRNIRFARCNNELNGGAIFGDDGGVLIIENSIFEDNLGYSGGAIDIRAFSSLTITDSTFRNNRAYGAFSQGGGALFLENYAQSISGSTFSNNESASTGSAIFFSGYSPTTSSITNSTFSGNVATDGSTIVNGFGAGILDLRNITVANNLSTAAAIARETTSNNQVNLTNSIVSANTGGNVSGLINLVGPNYTGTAPMLAALTNNGGETETRALLSGSPAIDAGSLTNAPATDQRGATRPQGTGVDLGAFESGSAFASASTPTGSGVSVSMGAVSVTFTGVSSGGTTTQTPIAPASAGTLPNGYSLGTGFPAFEISTTAVVTPPIIVCITVGQGTTLTQFNALRILHNEGGTLVDRTIRSPDSPAPNFAIKTICANVSSLSPFVVAENVAPTAADLSVSGRVLTPEGRGLSNATVYLTDSDGVMRYVRSNTFGYYRFDEIEAGQTVLMGVRSKRFSFEPRVITINENLLDFDFYPNENMESLRLSGNRGLK